ncbi:transposase [Kitasatospora purpeofusca]|uniref:transposase n=1 Tax=Kitasatospora purpeofusca TaxID=67352 RepID=UPI002E2C1AEC|nr:transposase [Kitasatospora purpeofusca]
MHLRYSYRICPTESQQRSPARTFGCARVVYNDALAARKQARRDGRPYPRSADLQKLVITGAKRTAERAWLASVGVDPLIQSLRDLDTAYRNFFDSVSGKRAGRQVGLPRFKSKRDNRQSLRKPPATDGTSASSAGTNPRRRCVPPAGSWTDPSR